ncbi:unnamed protein product [Closterium sp. NIES-64]|nr:unnamed protein product [Closterium sp. NIES-64]
MRKCGAPKPAPGPSLMHPPPQYSHAPSQAAAPMPGDPGAPMHAMHAMPPMQPLGAPYMPAMPPAHYAPYPPMPSPAPMYGAPAMPPPYDPSAHLAPPYMPQAMPHMPMPPAHPFAPYPMDAYRPMPPVSHPMPPVSRPRCFPRPALASPCHSLPSPPRARPRHPCCPLCRPVPILGLSPIPGHAAAARGGGGRAEAEGGTGGEWGGGLATTASSHHLHHHAPLSPSRPIPLAAISLTSPHSLHLFIPILLTSCICPSNPSPPTPWPICPAWGRAGVQAAAPDGSWACSECGNVNYPFRSHCNRRHCGRPRPTHDTAAAAGSGGGDAAGAVKQEVCPPGLRSRAIHEVM